MPDDAPVAPNETPADVSVSLETEPAANAAPASDSDVRRIMVHLPLAAITALQDRGFLVRGEDDDADIADALLEMLGMAWRAGIRADGVPVGAAETKRAAFLSRLAEVNADG
jgi:hypothetical protein